jgi:hypothetical protein
LKDNIRIDTGNDIVAHNAESPLTMLQHIGRIWLHGIQEAEKEKGGDPKGDRKRQEKKAEEHTDDFIYDDKRRIFSPGYALNSFRGNDSHEEQRKRYAPGKGVVTSQEIKERHACDTTKSPRDKRQISYTKN